MFRNRVSRNFRGTSSRNRQPRRRRRQTPTSGASIGYAPASVGFTDQQRKIHFSGVTSGSESGLRIQGRQRFCKVQVNGDGTSILLSAGNTNVDYILFDVNDSSSCPAPLSLLADCFARRRVRGVEFEYEPNTSTQVNFGVTFGWSSDPKMATLISSESDLSQLQDSVTTALWKPCTLKARLPQNPQIEYTYSSGTTTADYRLTNSGVFMGRPAGDVPAEYYSVTLGQVWMRYDIEFYELSNLAGQTELRRRELKSKVLTAYADERETELKQLSVDYREEKKTKAPSSSALPGEQARSVGAVQVPPNTPSIRSSLDDDVVMVDRPSLNKASLAVRRQGL